MTHKCKGNLKKIWDDLKVNSLQRSLYFEHGKQSGGYRSKDEKFTKYNKTLKSQSFVLGHNTKFLERKNVSHALDPSVF